MTTVVHCKKEPYDVLIDRTTIFGNPYPITDECNREQSIAKYTLYFYMRIETDKKFFQKVIKLKDKVLGCWCKPLACHGDVIAKYLDGVKDGKW